MSRASDRWYQSALSEKSQGDFCANRSDWRGAYARYGTAVEYLIKAIYLRNHQRIEFSGDMKSAASHDLGWIADKAGLGGEIGSFTGSQRSFWLVVRDWDQTRRYPTEPFPAKEGRDFKIALLHPTYGIWQWLLSNYQTN